MNEALVLYLAFLCEMFYKEKKEIKYDRPFSLVKNNFGKTPSDYAILEEFGLAVKHGDPGHWKPTRKAFDFLSDRIQIPKSYTEGVSTKIFSNELIYAHEILERQITLSWNPIPVAKPQSGFTHLKFTPPPIVEAEPVNNLKDYE
jgi:hypothetical protein